MPNLNSNIRLPSFSRKKLLLIGFLFVILLVIPATVFLVQQQQDLRTRATPNTTLSFVPSEQTATVGAKLNFEIWVSPGNNQVNFIKLVINWDATKLSATKESFVLDPASNLSILEGPILSATEDELAVNLSIESDPTKVIQQDTKIGDITFDVIEFSETPTEIAFDNEKVEIRSISGANLDEFSENVYLKNGTPAAVTFQGEGEATPTPTVTEVEEEATPTPTGTESADGEAPSENQAPVCESLVTDTSTEGAAPLTITFTANGSDTDGTIDKITFNFGEGTVEDVTTGGGIGTEIVSVEKAFTYNNAGTFTASALLTDDSGGVSSNSTNCSVTITVSGDSESAEPTPLPATGPTETIIGLGVLGGILFLIGALLFFAL
ncbi:MAG: PKD domain-containing protein [Candidatus Levybacteria bacterium]|nr:PKD domain-containing protein [Candidatus Levybacteria bacterium]